MKSKKPILVTGSHRSGTTWIGRTISQHPRVRYVHEPFNVDNPNPIMGLKLDTWFSHFQSSNQKEAIIASFNELLKPTPLEYAVKTCIEAGMDIKTPLRFGKHLLFGALLRPRILLKDPIALLSAGWLHEQYGFKVIVMIRNPLAFVGSLKKAGWDFDFEELRKQKVLMKTRLNRFAHDVEYMCTPKGRNGSDLIDRTTLLWNILHSVILDYQVQYPKWLFVRHEDISMNPRTGFHRIFDYLGLELSDNILRYIESYTSHVNPMEVATTSYQPRDSKMNLQTWKERLSDQEKERVKITTSEIASQFYEKIV